MTYDLYFHNDFDGRASAAVFLDFFRQQGGSDRIANYIPVSYPVPKSWKRLDFFKKPNVLGGKGNPAIIVDFRYHPSAAFWIDHHATTFAYPAWEQNFKGTSYHNWDVSYASCCRQVVDVLAQQFHYKHSAHIRELAKWLDVVDGARYKSSRQAVFQKEPALRISQYINEYSKKGQSLTWLIRALSELSLREIAASPRVQVSSRRFDAHVGEAVLVYKRLGELRGPAVFTDLVQAPKNIQEVRYAPYYLFPNCLFAVTLRRRSDGMYHISAGVNPWKRAAISGLKHPPHFGEIMKQFGGGGHSQVGGVELKSYRKALDICSSLSKIFAASNY